MTHDELLQKIDYYFDTDNFHIHKNALCTVVELAGKDIEHESYVWLDGYDYAMKQIIQAIEKELG
jgi:hypothetical protein